MQICALFASDLLKKIIHEHVMMFTKNVNERGKSVNKFRGALLNRNYWNNGKCSIQMPKCSGSEGKTITKAKIDKQIEFVKIYN